MRLWGVMIEQPEPKKKDATSVIKLHITLFYGQLPSKIRSLQEQGMDLRNIGWRSHANYGTWLDGTTVNPPRSAGNSGLS